MKTSAKQFLENLLSTASPSGFESDIQEVIRKRVSRAADETFKDVHGNFYAVKNPKGKIRVMLAGHCDQIGMMVNHIDEKGFLYVSSIGGIDAAVLPGTRLLVNTEKGQIPGCIGHKAIHLTPPEERGKKVDIKKLWVDIGAKDGEEAKSKVKVGDSITYRPEIDYLGKHRLVAPGCDDRVGAWVIMEAFLQFCEGLKKRSSNVALYSVSTVQEEIGLRGARTAAHEVDPHVGIAVDVTHASDNPAANINEVGDVKLGEGPTVARGANINPPLEKLLRDIARKKKIAHQLLASPRATGTDANAMQVTRSGVATALLGIPNRYMHSQVEMVDLRDLESTAKLISETCFAIKTNTSFIP